MSERVPGSARAPSLSPSAKGLVMAAFRSARLEYYKSDDDSFQACSRFVSTFTRRPQHDTRAFLRACVFYLLFFFTTHVSIRPVFMPRYGRKSCSAIGLALFSFGSHRVSAARAYSVIFAGDGPMQRRRRRKHWRKYIRREHFDGRCLRNISAGAVPLVKGPALMTLPPRR